MRRLSRSHQERSIGDVWDWFEAVRSSLLQRRDALRQAALQVTSAPVPEGFTDLTEQELDERFSELQDELAQMACLDILAAAEAAICIDFRLRADTKRPRGRLTDTYREVWRRISRRRRPRPRLEEDILEAVRRAIQDRTLHAALGEFASALRYRHWLAHGRYWQAKLGRRYDPQGVYDISYHMLSALGLLGGPGEP